MHRELPSPYRFAPDGLAGDMLNDLVDRAYAEVADAAGPTSALVDGTAAEQRTRRMERRASAAVTSALPVRRRALDSAERRVA